MQSLVKAELLRQRTTRMVPVTLTLSLAFAVFVVTQVVDGAGVRGAPAAGTDELAGQILSIPGLAALPLLVLGVLSVTGEERHRTLTSTVLAEPRRWRLIAAKAIASAGLALAWGVLAMVAVNATATVLLGQEGVDHLSTITPSLWRSAAAIGVVLPLHAAMGVGIGAIARNQVAGTLVPVVWMLLLEPNVVAPRFPAVQELLPATATSIAGGSPYAPDAPAWLGLLVLTAWAALLTTVGTQLVRRRDL